MLLNVAVMEVAALRGRTDHAAIRLEVMSSEQQPACALRNVHQVHSGRRGALPFDTCRGPGAFQDSTYLTLSIPEGIGCLSSVHLHCERCQNGQQKKRPDIIRFE